MLRTLIVLLILLNALFFGWSRGWLDAATGIKASGDREPERLARQVHPERIQLLGAQAAAALQQRTCMELAGLDSEDAQQAAQAALLRAGLPAAAVTGSSSEQAGIWAVATIKLGTKDFRDRKEETYKRLRIPFEPLSGPADELPSLVLGRFPSAAAADAALEAFTQRALKGLRVLQLQAPSRQFSLRIAEADGAMQAKLKGLKDPALAAGFKACAAAPAAEAASAAASAP